MFDSSKLKVIKKEVPFLIEGSLFSTSKNGKTLKIAYERKERDDTDVYGFNFPEEVGRPVIALIARDRMVHKSYLRYVYIDEEKKVFLAEDVNKTFDSYVGVDEEIYKYKDVVFLDKQHLEFFRDFYKLNFEI